MTLISQAFQAFMYGGSNGPWKDGDYAWIHPADDGIGDRVSAVEKRPNPVTEVEQFAWSYHFGGPHGRWTPAAYPALIGDGGHGVDDRLKRLE